MFIYQVICSGGMYEDAYENTLLCTLDINKAIQTAKISKEFNDYVDIHIWENDKMEFSFELDGTFDEKIIKFIKDYL